MASVQVGDESYFIDDNLKRRWDAIKDGKLFKSDEDRVYVVDGRERSGKSVFTLQQAAYIDPTIIEPGEAQKRITFDPEDGLRSIRETNSNSDQTKVLIFDEAFRGLSSRAALSKTNKKIIQALMEMGQKNLVLFIVLPSFFMLDLYPAMIRSNALFHITKKRGSKRRSFHIYNYSKKASLYQIGIKKGWKYHVNTRFKGRFYGKYPGGDSFEKLYRKMKKDSLEKAEQVFDKQAQESKYLNQRNILITEIYKDLKSYRQVSERLKELGVRMSHTQVMEVVRKPKEIEVTSSDVSGKNNNISV